MCVQRRKMVVCKEFTIAWDYTAITTFTTSWRCTAMKPFTIAWDPVAMASRWQDSGNNYGMMT